MRQSPSVHSREGVLVVESSLVQYQAQFGPIPAWVGKAATRLSMWPLAEQRLSEAVQQGKAITDWQAFEDELQRRFWGMTAQQPSGEPAPFLRITRSVFDTRVIDYGPQVLNWDE